MAEYTRLQNSFASGYLDPTLHGLVTSETYGSGLKKCLNFLPSSLGYLYRRPGTRFVGVSLASINGNCKIHAVKTDKGPMVVVISKGKMDFYSIDNLNETSFHISDGVEYDTTGNKNYIPWEDDEIPDIDIYEFEGSLYIVHYNHPPCIVQSVDSGIGSLTFEVKGNATYAGPSTPYSLKTSELLAPNGFFCRKLNFSSDGIETFSSPKHYPSCQTFKGGRWFLGGCKASPATIYASKSPDVKGDYRFTDFSVGTYYLAHIHTSMTKTTIYTTNEGDGDNAIKTVSYNSEDSSTKADQVTGDGLDIVVPDSSSETHYYRYTDEQGTTTVPGSTDVMVASSTVQSQTKRLDVVTTADTWSLKSDIQNDDAIEISESDMYGSRLNWMITQQRVIAGTSRSIWMDNGSAATPADFDMVKTLGTTTSKIKPILYSSMIVFVPADLRSVKAFYYDNNAGGYQMLDLTASARSLFRESDIKEIAMVEGQEPILWLLLANGKLLSCTIGSTYGWAEHELGGSGSVQSIFPYQDETGLGSLFLVVRRGTRMSVERLVLENLVNTDVFTLCDCSTEISSYGGTVDFTTNNTYAVGDEVQIVAGGWPRSPFQYAKEQIDIGPGSTAGIYIGYPYRSECTMLWQELPTNASQSSLSFFRKATSMALLLYRSAGAECGWYSGDRKHLDPFQRLAKSNATESTYADYYTGIVKLSVPSNTSDQVNATVECSQPLPMTIQAVETRYIIQEA